MSTSREVSPASSSDDSSVAEQKVRGSTPLPASQMKTESETFASKAVCKIINRTKDDYIGTGFLGHITVQIGDDTSATDFFGLFTNNHVLNYRDLRDNAQPIKIELQFNNDDPDLVYRFTIGELQNRFRFTCTLLDVTFIEFSEEEVTKVQSSGSINFLECDPSPVTEEELDSNQTTAMVAGHPDMSEDTDSLDNRHRPTIKRYAKGPLYKCSGFNIVHRISTNPGSSGSPLLVLARGQPAPQQQYVAKGIHKGSVPKSMERNTSNIATSMEAVAEAMKNLRINTLRQLTWKANDVSYKILLQNGLKKRSNASHEEQTELFSYTSNEVETWFTFTSHGWYWTKDNPCDWRQDLFSHLTWMSISNSKDMDPEAIKKAEWLKRENKYFINK